MEIRYTPYRIQCTHPFGISRSSHTYYDIVYVYLIGEGVTGRGEAAPSNRYGESTAGILTRLSERFPVPEYDLTMETMEDALIDQAGGIYSLEAAFSMAAADWRAQKEGIPLYHLFQVDPGRLPQTSFTIAIGDLDSIPEKIEEAAPFPILKVKLGTPDQDKKIMQSIRACTDKLIRVDANEGWDLETAKHMCRWLADYNVEFIEQPLPANQIEQTARLKAVSPLKLIADENSRTSADIPGIVHAFHGINIKLMKCGSLTEAKRMIDLAREHDMEVMLGCMVESSVAITAAAHLAPLVDYADLDGNLLITNDPYNGVRTDHGNMTLPEGNGLGVSLNREYLTRKENLL